MMQRRAVLSGDREYRYSLERIWQPLKPRVLWLMLNPSTADENFDDATIRRCVGFSQRWGFGGPRRRQLLRPAVNGPLRSPQAS